MIICKIEHRRMPMLYFDDSPETRTHACDGILLYGGGTFAHAIPNPSDLKSSSREEHQKRVQDVSCTLFW